MLHLMRKPQPGIRLLLSIVAISIVAGLSTGCTKHNSETLYATADSGKLRLHIHTYLDTTEVNAYNKLYTLATGRQISFSLAQFWVSGIEMIKQDGTAVRVPGLLLKTLGKEQYEIGPLPVGAYRSIRFLVGFDSTDYLQQRLRDSFARHSEMAIPRSGTLPETNAFLVAQGSIDTSVSGASSSASMQPFSFRIGGQSRYKVISMRDHNTIYNVSKGNIREVHFWLDYARLFDGLVLNNVANLQVLSANSNDKPRADSIANNLTGAFDYEDE
jgi:hypothetical protein